MDQFKKWFKLQFGSLPEYMRPQHAILEDLIKAKGRVAELERELHEQRRIHYSWEAAQYCRNAAEKEFKT